jgi:hypothetical protein
MWSEDEKARPDSTRDAAEPRAQTHGRAADPAKGDVRREAAKVMVVGPPGCCGCVNQSVSTSSRRKR